MKVEKSERGFEYLMHKGYPDPDLTRLASESSAINTDYEDGMDIPGSSFLWIGANHHLNRAEVQQFIHHLTHWVQHGTLNTRRSEERRVGKECRYRWSPEHQKRQRR